MGVHIFTRIHKCVCKILTVLNCEIIQCIVLCEIPIKVANKTGNCFPQEYRKRRYDGQAVFIPPAPRYELWFKLLVITSRESRLHHTSSNTQAEDSITNHAEPEANLQCQVPRTLWRAGWACSRHVLPLATFLRSKRPWHWLPICYIETTWPISFGNYSKGSIS